MPDFRVRFLYLSAHRSYSSIPINCSWSCLATAVQVTFSRLTLLMKEIIQWIFINCGKYNLSCWCLCKFVLFCIFVKPASLSGMLFLLNASLCFHIVLSCHLSLICEVFVYVPVSEVIIDNLVNMTGKSFFFLNEGVLLNSLRYHGGLKNPSVRRKARIWWTLFYGNSHRIFLSPSSTGPPNV